MITVLETPAPSVTPTRAAALSGTIVDITERKHIEERLRLSQKMDAFGHFAVGIAHDFNNLLTVIIGASAMLHERIRDHPDIAADVTKSSRRASGPPPSRASFSRRAGSRFRRRRSST